jgi:hypothetical protein
VTTVSQDWYYRDFARTSPVQGPFTLAELAERVQTGELAHDSLVRCGDGEWLQADRITEVIEAIRQRRVPNPEFAAMPVPDKADPRSRRQLNWFKLFVVAISLAVIGGLLMAFGISNWRYGPLVVPGQLISAVASIILLCAIIRWAIEPLYAQLVDSNDRLSKIARLLDDKDREG